MVDKDPIFSEILSQIASIAYIVFVSSFAGAIGYLNRISNKIHEFSWIHLLISFCVGGLNGYLVFLLCDAAGWSWQVTAFMSGAGGAMGSEVLNLLLSRTRRAIPLIGEDNGTDREEEA